MKTVKVLWEEILEIMDENIKAFSISSLDPAARVSKIKEMEERMNLQFPKGLKEIYLSNDGSLGLAAILGFELISLDDMLIEWKNNIKILNDGSYNKIDIKSSKEGFIKEVYFDEKWIPFAFNNLHTYLAIDLNPGINGKIGQVINFGGTGNEVKYILADSLENLLEDVIMIYEYNGLKIEDEIQVDENKEDDLKELITFMDNHFFNIVEDYKSADSVYEDLDLSYNTREYDDYQQEDGYEYEDENEDDFSHYKEYDGYGIEENY